MSLCILYLSVLGVYATYSMVIKNSAALPYIFLNFFFITLINVFIPWFLTYTKVKMVNTNDSIISGLILFLLIDPKQSLAVTFAVCLFVLLSRLFIRYKSMPIFNPVAFGVGLVALLPLNLIVAWWGVSFAPRLTDYRLSMAIILTLPFGLFFIYRFRKLYLAASALIFSSVIYVILRPSIFGETIDVIKDSYLYLFLEGTLLFAILVMVCEPKSSPMKKVQQVIFGFVFALSWVTLNYENVSQSIIFAILISNAVYFIMRFIDNHPIFGPQKHVIQRAAQVGIVSLTAITVAGIAIFFPQSSLVDQSKASVNDSATPIDAKVNITCDSFSGTININTSNIKKLRVRAFRDGNKNMVSQVGDVYTDENITSLDNLSFTIPTSVRLRDGSLHTLAFYATDPASGTEFFLNIGTPTLKCDTPPTASLSGSSVVCVNKNNVYTIAHSGTTGDILVTKSDGSEVENCKDPVTEKNTKLCRLGISSRSSFSVDWTPTSVGDYYITARSLRENSKCTGNPFVEVSTDLPGWAPCGPTDSIAVTVKVC